MTGTILANADLVLPDVCAESPGRRAGVFTAIARPTRFVRALEQRGIVPRVVVRARDHLARGSERQAARMAGRWGVDYWLTTEKCSFSLEKSWLGAPRYTVALRLALAPTFVARLRLLRDGP